MCRPLATTLTLSWLESHSTLCQCEGRGVQVVGETDDGRRESNMVKHPRRLRVKGCHW